jgi:hypothetical protein
MNNGMFTEDQRTEAFRNEVAQQLQKQAELLEKQGKAVDTIKTIVVLWLVLGLLGVLFMMIGAASSNY